MTFDDVVGIIGKIVGSMIEYGAEEGQRVQERYDQRMEQVEKCKEHIDYLDDRALYERYKASSGIQKEACAQLLEERGYQRKRREPEED
ncbi:MAG: hypothetical protein LUE89_05675 [Clostridiales bacterium]|nr:hypothetical protein [Clostridiales bacterium]